MNVLELQAELQKRVQDHVVAGGDARNIKCVVSTAHYDCFSEEIEIEDVVTIDGVQKIMIVGGMCKT